MKYFFVFLLLVTKGFAQTTLFLFNNGTTVTTDNVVGTPSASASTTTGDFFIGECTPNIVLANSFSWPTGTYYEFIVNPAGYKDLVFTYNEKASNSQIGTFDVRVSSNGSSWLTIRSNYTPPTASCSSSGSIIIPSSFNDQTNLIIRIFKIDNANGGTRSYQIDDVVLTGIRIKLPIHLASFDLSLQNHKPSIKWSTFSELNNQYFSILRSSNGIDFYEIKRIVGFGSGASDNNLEYSYLDEKPLVGINYYRLKQVDLDGTETIFPIKSIFVQPLKTIVYPTVFSEKLNIVFDQIPIGKSEWNLFNLQGQIIRNGKLDDQRQQQELQFHGLQKGIFVLTLNRGDKMESFRVIKN